MLPFERARRRATLVMVLTLSLASITAPRLSAQQASSHPFVPGEHHEYELKFGFLTVGTGQLSVSGPDTLRGREVFRLRYQIDGGVPFFRVHDEMESWFDPKALLSLRFTQELHEGSKRYSRYFDFFPEESVVLERGKGRAPSVPEPLDDASFIFFLRTQAFAPGVIVTSNRYFRPDGNPVVVQMLRRETITVPAGTFATIVVQPRIRTAGIFSDGGEALLWFADDSTRTLIQMKAKLSFGTIGLFLKPDRAR